MTQISALTLLRMRDLCEDVRCVFRGTSHAVTVDTYGKAIQLQAEIDAVLAMLPVAVGSDNL
jgi:hypothetical protein